MKDLEAKEGKVAMCFAPLAPGFVHFRQTNDDSITTSQTFFDCMALVNSNRIPTRFKYSRLDGLAHSRVKIGLSLSRES